MAELSAAAPKPSTAVPKPYDWDRYDEHWEPKEAYDLQEQVLQEEFAGLAYPVSLGYSAGPASVLEVGPGLGRITKYLVAMWPKARFVLCDISEAAIEKTRAAIPDVEFAGAWAPKGIQDEETGRELLHPFPKGFDLVVAVEVLLHIPPNEVESAARNLLKAVKPYSGHLVTCDWTVPRGTADATDEADRAIAQNWRHAYEQLFHVIGASVISSRRTGLQTVYVVQP